MKRSAGVLPGWHRKVDSYTRVFIVAVGCCFGRPINAAPEAVCAQVSIGLSQSVVMTSSGFSVRLAVKGLPEGLPHPPIRRLP